MIRNELFISIIHVGSGSVILRRRRQGNILRGPNVLASSRVMMTLSRRSGMWLWRRVIARSDDITTVGWHHTALVAPEHRIRRAGRVAVTIRRVVAELSTAYHTSTSTATTLLILRRRCRRRRDRRVVDHFRGCGQVNRTQTRVAVVHAQSTLMTQVVRVTVGVAHRTIMLALMHRCRVVHRLWRLIEEFLRQRCWYLTHGCLKLLLGLLLLLLLKYIKLEKQKSVVEKN